MSLVVICQVPLDERNGGGMRTLIRYLSDLKEPTVYSIHLGITRDIDQHPLASVQYIHICHPKNILKYFVWFNDLRKSLNSISNKKLRIIVLPNALDDLFLGCTAVILGHNVTTWFMDDFATATVPARFTRLRKKVTQALFKFLYLFAHRRILISSSMFQEYKTRYGKSADLVIGKMWPHKDILKNAEFARLKECTFQKKTIRIIWVGAFIQYYFEPFQAFVELFKKHKDLDIIIDLYGQRLPFDYCLLPGKIEYKGSFEDCELLDILKNYDYGFLTYSFDDYTRNFMKFSFPGKLVDYLSAGLPVVTVSPADIGVIDVIREKNVGPICNSLELSALFSLVQNLPHLGDTTYKVFCENSKKWALDEFVYEEGFKKFTEIING